MADKPINTSKSRRNLVKNLTFTGGSIATLGAFSGDWKTPELQSIVLPSHASTSYLCMIPYEVTGSATMTTDSNTFLGTYTGSLNPSGPFGTDCEIISPLVFESQPLEVTISHMGDGVFQFVHNLPSADFSFSYQSTLTEVNVANPVDFSMSLAMGVTQTDVIPLPEQSFPLQAANLGDLLAGDSNESIQATLRPISDNEISLSTRRFGYLGVRYQ